jgi:hypothetical protein
LKKTLNLISLFFLCVFFTHAQDTNYILAKITVDSWEQPKFNDAAVIYTNVISHQTKTDTTKNGYCEIKLDLNTAYHIEIRHHDFYTKSVEVETEVPRKHLHKSFELILEFLLKKNCDNDPQKHLITKEPMGRVTFDKHLKKFQYDFDFTYRMEAKYEEERKTRCRIAEEMRREAKRQEEERQKALKLAEKQAAEQAELERLAAEKARIDSIQAAEAQKEADRLAMIEQKRQDREAEEERIRLENERKRLERSERLAEQKRLEEEAKEAKAREPKFDETKDRIYIYPKNSWPSKLATSIREPGTDVGAIGTFTYSITEGVKEFFVEDAEELKQKFPEEFAKAFPRWDYIVEVNMKYKGQ